MADFNCKPIKDTGLFVITSTFDNGVCLYGLCIKDNKEDIELHGEESSLKC
jgi:hypothetical protein